MSDPNYIKRIQLMRERNILSRTKGKPLIFPENQLIDLMVLNKIPTQMQHCILKVFPKMAGVEHEKFVSAANICAAVFIKYGYQKPGSTVLTGKGLRNNTRHRLEVAASSKKAQYEGLVNRLWRGYLDRRVRSYREQKKAESVSPDTNIQKQQMPTTPVTPMSPMARMMAPPNMNIAQTKMTPITKTILPGQPSSNIGKPPQSLQQPQGTPATNTAPGINMKKKSGLTALQQANVKVPKLSKLYDEE